MPASSPHLTISCSAFLLILCLSACKYNQPPDPAESLTGTYIGHRTSTTILAGQTTVYYDGPDTTLVENTGEEGVLKIGGITAMLESGNVIDTAFGIHTWFSASFPADSLYWTYSDGGLGGSSTSVFRGKRQ